MFPSVPQIPAGPGSLVRKCQSDAALPWRGPLVPLPRPPKSPPGLSEPAGRRSSHACCPAGAKFGRESGGHFCSLPIPSQRSTPPHPPQEPLQARILAGGWATWELTLESTLSDPANFELAEPLPGRWESAPGRARGPARRTSPGSRRVGPPRHPRAAAAPRPESPATRPQVVAPRLPPEES